MTERSSIDDRRHRTHSGVDAPHGKMGADPTAITGRRERSRRIPGERERAGRSGGRRRGSIGSGRPSRGAEGRGSERARGTESGPGDRLRHLLPALQHALTLQFVLTLQFALALQSVVGVATAHGGGTSDRGGHLVVDFIGFVAFAFLVYLAFLFARDVLYRRLRNAFDR